ncbi:MAG TPA: hypothetical protein VG826_11495 [Pirellulales bacterium]|nr:hypothetical protein [Pirellulales bacterium]
MAQVSPFHSTQNPGVYHVCSNCTEGNNIEKQYLKQGTGGGSLCVHCAKLQKEKKC